MFFKNAFAVAAATYFATGANAHMKLATPAPFGPDTLNNSPLDASGSDFPCKQRPGVYAPAKSTATMPIGAKQTLSFIGGATHGGGSCQVSLTSDKAPTKNSEFKVIHSIEGGCPTASEGNIGSDASALDPTTFQYSIPAGIAPGEYTLAWTWFNKVGNREMYMNCAPIVVTGGGGSSAKRDIEETPALDGEPSYNETTTADFDLLARDATFPAMFVANIPATDCTTTESTDVQFPDPGASVEKAPSAKLGPPTGPKCGTNKASSGSGSGSGSGSNAQPAVQPSVAPVASPSPAKAAVPGTATIFAEPSAAPAASGSGSVLTCSPDAFKFKLVGGPWQAVAAGTKCVGGEIVMASAKRSAKFGRGFNG